MKTIAIATIEGIEVEYQLTGTRGHWTWICPDGQPAGDAAGGETKSAALENLNLNLNNDEPEYEGIRWA